MNDVRDRLRPLLYSGVPHQVQAVIAEVIERDDAALYSWLLEAIYVRPKPTGIRQWRTDDTSEFRHPALQPEEALRIVSRANSPRAAELRAAIPHLCIDLGFNRRDEPALDVSGCRGLTTVTKLRILGHEPENLYAWRERFAALPPRPLVDAAAIATLSSLEHLTLIGCAIDAALLARLPTLRFLEVVGSDLGDFTPPAGLHDLALVACRVTISALPPSLQRLHVENCGELTLPATSASVSYTPGPLLRTAITGSVFVSAAEA